ncbi:hypothetical protein HGM15179_015193 [Zosterops borbonicus]|uniref:Envelope protein n=1 Tax=Zosterops borbonicus TaxID=364589 RepID=A0A8K1G554_9PASS|nr:hypothetical protein HGM15179_015193 [Zosterops borbonicus]
MNFMAVLNEHQVREIAATEVCKIKFQSQAAASTFYLEVSLPKASLLQGKSSWNLCLHRWFDLDRDRYHHLLHDNSADMPVNQPKTNIWVALANSAGSDTICFTHSRPGKPFAAGLVGVPVPAKEWPIPNRDSFWREAANETNPVIDWYHWAPDLLKAPFEPQELEILGSLTMEFCAEFQYQGNPQLNVTPHHPVYRNSSFWCNSTTPVPPKGKTVDLDEFPQQLPKGYWLICGDRAWQGIPSKIKGGPCSIGQLTVIAPSVKKAIKKNYRGKRFTHHYEENCNDNFKPRSPAKQVTSDLFLPQLASAVALKQLDRLGCWLGKETNATSIVISNMMTDVDAARHAALQNRAAIDFLLLAHGHGCEEFGGLCCMNFSDHSESIYKKLQKLKDLANQIKRDNGSWLDDLFEGWNFAPWLKELCKIGFYVLIVIVVILVMLPCILLYAQQTMNKAIKEVFTVQRRGGDVRNGFVEDSQSLTESSHSLLHLYANSEISIENEFLQQQCNIMGHSALLPDTGRALLGDGKPALQLNMQP